MKPKLIIGGVIVVVFMVWGTTAFLKTTIQYVSIPQARDSEKMVQVMGKIDFQTKNYDAEETRLEFAIFDPEAVDSTSAERMDVVYYGVVPGNFDQATSVVVKGKQVGDEFVADQLLVKCPSKYQGDSDGYQDVEKHNQAQSVSGA